jgi:hypothetical protein
MMDELFDEDEDFRRAQAAAGMARTERDREPKPKPEPEPRDTRHIGCPLASFRQAYAVARSKGDLAVWLWLWRLRKLCRNRTIKVTNSGLADLGVTRFAKYRALRRYAAAGLIGIRRKNKHALEVKFNR